MKNSLRALMIGLCVGSPLALAQPTASPAAPAKAVEKADAVKLIDAGAEPRRVLRYTATKGDVFGIEIRMKMDMKTTVEGTAAPTPQMPTMVMAGNVKVVDVMPDGSAKINFVYNQMGVDETEGAPAVVVDAMKASLEKMNGLGGEFVISSRGEYLSGEFKVPEDADAVVKQTMAGMSKSMEQMTVPLPAAAVGKGAKWTCERTQDANGIAIKAQYAQELTALTDKGFTATIDVKGDAPKQEMKGPAAGMGIMIESMTMTGTGSLATDLSQMMPSTFRMDSKMKMEMSIPVQGKDSKALTSGDIMMAMKVTEPKEAPAAKPGAGKPDTAKPDSTKPAPKF